MYASPGSFFSQMHERYLFPAVVLLGIGALEACSLVYVYGLLAASLLLSSMAILLGWAPFFLTQNVFFKICAGVNLICLIYPGFFPVKRRFIARQ